MQVKRILNGPAMSEHGPVFLYRPGGLGDLLVTLPAIAFLRRRFSGIPLHLIAGKRPGELLKKAGLVDFVHSSDDPVWARLYSEDRDSAPPDWPGRVSPSAMWSWFLNDPSPEFGRNGRRFFGGDFRAFVYDAASGVPLSRFFFGRTAAAAGVAGTDAEFADCARLPIPEDWRSAGKKFFFDRPPSSAVGPASPGEIPPFAVIHPGSGGASKCWPLDRFLEMAVRLAGSGWAGILVTGQAEERLDAGPAEKALPPGWRRIHDPPLEALAGLLSRCAVYLGNDSGVTHLAAAAGARVTALFRRPNVPAWRPFGRSTILQAPEVAGISVEDVWAVVRRIPDLDGGPGGKLPPNSPVVSGQGRVAGPRPVS
jgi:hypothetical protein